MLHASATGTPFAGRLFGMSSVLVAALRVAANVDLVPALISGPPQSSLASYANAVECALTPSRAKPTVMGGHQVCNQACRPCTVIDDGSVTVTTQ